MDNLLNFYEFFPNARETALLEAFKETFPHVRSITSPYVAEANAGLVQALHSLGTVGITVTCQVFTRLKGRQLRAPGRLTHWAESLASFRFENQSIVNFEMETSAILGLSRLLGITQRRCVVDWESTIAFGEPRYSSCDRSHDSAGTRP